MTILPKLIYRVSAIPLQILDDFLIEITKLVLKFKTNKKENGQNNIEKEE